MENIPPRPIKHNSLQKLVMLQPPEKKMSWCTFAFALNNDIKDSKDDDLYGMIIPLGSFKTKEASDSHAKHIVEVTGHPSVVSARYACAVPMMSTFDSEHNVPVKVDVAGNIIKCEDSQYTRENEMYEKNLKRSEELEAEAEAETDPDHIEYMKRNCFLAVKNYAKYQHHLKEAEEAHKDYSTRKLNVQRHLQSHPNNEVEWLPYLRKKLYERGEESLYASIENGYKKIRDDILGLLDI